MENFKTLLNSSFCQKCIKKLSKNCCALLRHFFFSNATVNFFFFLKFFSRMKLKNEGVAVGRNNFLEHISDNWHWNNYFFCYFFTFFQKIFLKISKFLKFYRNLQTITLEYTCQVEAASFQSTPKVREKEDKYVNTIDEDDHYKSFLQKEGIWITLN